MANEELAGHWWLPESPEQKVAGILSCDDDGRQELRLIGSFHDPFTELTKKSGSSGEATLEITEETFSKRGVYPRIHGLVGSNSYDLENCYQVHSTWQLTGGTGSERIHVHQSFTGVQFESGEAVEFTRLKLSILGLPYWVVATGLQEATSWEKDEGGGNKNFIHEVKVAGLPEIEISNKAGKQLSFIHGYRVTGDRRTEIQFLQDFKFVIETDVVRPMQEFLDAASALQDLLTIAIGRPAAFKELAFQHPDIKMDQGSETRYLDIFMQAQWAVRPAARKKALRDSDVVFTLDDFGGPTQVEKWMVVAHENRTTRARVMSTKYSSGRYVGDVFFGRAAALEAYDRQKNGGKSHFQTRLKQCAAHAGEPFQTLVGDVNKWVMLVKNNRNDVAHHNDGIADATSEQVILGESAFWLYVFCLLRDAGTPDAVFAKVKEQQFYSRLTNDVAGLLSAA